MTSDLTRECHLVFVRVLVERAGFKPDTLPAIVADWYEERDRAAIANFLRAVAREDLTDANSLPRGE